MRQPSSNGPASIDESRAERREHRAAGRDVFLDAPRLDVGERARVGDDQQ